MTFETSLEAAVMTINVLMTPPIILRDFTYSCTAASQPTQSSNDLPFYFICRVSTVMSSGLDFSPTTADFDFDTTLYVDFPDS